MSFRTVTKPHMKKTVVTTVRARPVFWGAVPVAVLVVGRFMGSRASITDFAGQKGRASPHAYSQKFRVLWQKAPLCGGGGRLRPVNPSAARTSPVNHRNCNVILSILSVYICGNLPSLPRSEERRVGKEGRS